MEVANSKRMIEGSCKAISFMVVDSESNLLKDPHSTAVLHSHAVPHEQKVVHSRMAGRTVFLFILFIIGETQNKLE